MLNHVILNNQNKCHHRSKQLLFYIKVEERVRKIKTIKIIYPEFTFLIRQKELLIAAQTSAAIVNIDGANFYGVLNI